MTAASRAATAAKPDAAAAAPFHIPAAVSLQERRPRTLKHDDSFGVFDPNGDAVAGNDSVEGLYHRDTRYLSHFLLTLDGERPILLRSTVRDDNAMLTCDLTNPDLHDAAGGVLDHDTIHVRRTRFLWSGACHERLSIRHYGSAPRPLKLALSFGADFADLFEVRGTPRKQRGAYLPAEVETSAVTLAYRGLDNRTRRTTLRFAHQPDELAADGVVWNIVLQPGMSQLIDFAIECRGDDEQTAASLAFLPSLKRAYRALRTTAGRAAAISSSNTTFNEAVRRAVSDLYMLVTETADGPYPYAGIPWFSTVFGRDALITALQTLWLDPNIARGVLRHLARNQATASDAAADAEPGKILHELRHGEMANLGEVPFRRYYGSIDSTPLFVMLAGAYLERTADHDTLGKLWPNIAAALRWMDESGDRDGDGFIEYGRRHATGLANQGWKDSVDSVFHADGTLASGPIAMVEVQAYAYGAWMAAASIARALGKTAFAENYRARAEQLRRRFDEAFFDEEMGTYVLALDGQKKPCRVRASNAGHALFTGIAYEHRAPAVAALLTSPSFFSGWGIRTLAAGEPRYNPMSYHNGSVWPHDNALIAIGLARYGLRREAVHLLDAMFAASVHFDLRRLPELFCGFPRQRSSGPTFYPVACSPQAWAAATPLSLLQSCLGLSFDVVRGRIRLDSPLLPTFVDGLTLRRLSLGDGHVDLTLHRRGKDDLSVEVSGRQGRIGVDLS